MFEANKLLVASTIPSVFSSLWCFCDSKKVISSGRLVIKPNAIPSIISGILKILANSSNILLSSFPIKYNITDVTNKYIVYFTIINAFDLLFFTLFLDFSFFSFFKYNLCTFAFI